MKLGLKKQSNDNSAQILQNNPKTTFKSHPLSELALVEKQSEENSCKKEKPWNKFLQSK